MGNKHSKYPKLIYKINKSVDDKIQNKECPQLHNQDDRFIDRMQMLHHVMRCVWDGNFKAPLGEQLREGGVAVLDVCCGTATWISEMAADFPKSTFVGIEKDSIFPEQKPKNVRIIQGDVLENFPFPDNTFDLVYSRLNSLAFSEAQWRNHLIKEYVRVLKPGGYIECVEGGLISENSGTIVEQLSTAIEKTLILGGRNPFLESKFPEIIESQPLMGEVTQTEATMAIGSWGGQIGETGLVIMLNMMSGLKKGIMHHMKINEKGLERVLEDYKIEWSGCGTGCFGNAWKGSCPEVQNSTWQNDM
ncbi:263_t:CDS:2 [Scutellospora calospora]|uniref:263_t:CDS:1 n=1 Tax=Scutellospora calospora TaxID=85575 RepID=A0ACA9JUH4_9GLOM|nr:263_t:CDS:2 [Scutellospora calospora]